MNQVYTAQGYLEQFRAGLVTKAMSGVAGSLVDNRVPYAQVRTGPYYAVGSGQNWADLPTPMSSGGVTPRRLGGDGLPVMFGGRPMVYIPGMENLAQDPTSGLAVGPGGFTSWDHLGNLVGTTARGVATDRIGVKLKPAISKWAALHLQDLNAARGQVNAGNILTIASRRKLFFNDGGLRAARLEERAQAFAQSVLGPAGSGKDPLASFQEFRAHHLNEHAAVFRLIAPGKDHHLNSKGIKDASFKRIKRFRNGSWIDDTEMLVNAGSPNSFDAFGGMGDVMAGDNQANQYVTFDLFDVPKTKKINGKIVPFTNKGRRYFSRGMQHPLVAGSQYARELELMSAATGKQLGHFGTAVRADVGFITGQGAELFSSMALGDSGAVAFSSRLVHAAGLTSKPYEVKIRGIKGMHGFVNPTTELHPSFQKLPGMDTFLSDPSAKVLNFDTPQSLSINEGEALATMTGGKRLKGIKGYSRKDTVEKIVKTSTGLRIHMRRNQPVASVGRQITVETARASLKYGKQGLLVSKNGKNAVDMVTFDLKSGDPKIVRKRWLSHYASAVFSKDGLKKSEREVALRAFAEYSGLQVGQHYGGGKNPMLFLHTEGISASSPFANGSFATKEFRLGAAKAINAALKRKAFSNKSLAPKIRKLSRENLIRIMISGGEMNEAEATKNVDRYYAAAAAKFGQGAGDLTMPIFLGQTVRFRATDVGGLTGRVSISDAQNLLGKLVDYKGSNADIANKMADIVSGRISHIQDYVNLAQAAQSSTAMGDDAVQAVLKASGGKIKSVSLASLANEGLFNQVTADLDKHGTLTVDTYNKMISHFGMEKDDVGAFIDLKGTRFEGLTTFSGARDLGAKDAFSGKSNYAFLHNLRRVAPELNNATTTGFAGDVIRMPRKEIVETLAAHENKSLGILPNTFNAYLEFLNPYSGRGAMERRLWLQNAAAREWMIGSKGIAAKSAVKGFKAARFAAQNLGTLDDDFVVGLTEQGILKQFGSRDESVGKRMLADLQAGKDVFTFFKRDPVQSSQQLMSVRIKLIKDELKTATRIRAKIKGRMSTSETAFVSRMLAGASQGDFDGDNIALFLLRNSKAKGMDLSYEDQQKILRDVYSDTKVAAQFFGRMLDAQALDGGKGYTGKKINAENLAELMAGKKWGAVVDPTLSATEALLKMGVPKAQIDQGMIEALGNFQRSIQYGVGVSIMDTYATRMQDVYSSLSSAKLNKFNMPFTSLTAKAKEMGLDKLAHSKDADWIRFIYGFLKKGTQSTDATLRAVGALKRATVIDPNSSEYRSLVDDLAQNIMHMSEGVSGSKNAFYNFAREESVKQASKAAKAGAIDLTSEKSFYTSLSEEMLKVSRFEAWASANGRRSSTLIARGRRPDDVLTSIFEDLLGGKVNLPGTDSAGAELNARMSAFVDGMSDKNVNQAIAGAVDGVGQAINRAGGLIDDVASKTKGWGNLKTAAIVGGGIALIGMLGRNKQQPEPPAPEMSTGGSGMPPSPQVGFPSDGARPSALAPSVDTARIARVPGQRRHFGGQDSIFMPPQFDVMGDYHNQSLRGEDLGDLMPIQGSDDFSG